MSPRTTVIVPSVATNGLTPRYAISQPFAAPTSRHAAKAPATPTGMPGVPRSIISVAPTTLESAVTEPTDRSKPPRMIAKVMPQAMIPITEFCCRTLMMFW